MKYFGFKRFMTSFCVISVLLLWAQASAQQSLYLAADSASVSVFRWLRNGNTLTGNWTFARFARPDGFVSTIYRVTSQVSNVQGTITGSNISLTIESVGLARLTLLGSISKTTLVLNTPNSDGSTGKFQHQASGEKAYNEALSALKSNVAKANDLLVFEGKVARALGPVDDANAAYDQQRKNLLEINTKYSDFGYGSKHDLATVLEDARADYQQLEAASKGVEPCQQMNALTDNLNQLNARPGAFAALRSAVDTEMLEEVRLANIALDGADRALGQARVVLVNYEAAVKAAKLPVFLYRAVYSLAAIDTLAASYVKRRAGFQDEATQALRVTGAWELEIQRFVAGGADLVQALNCPKR